MFKFIYQVMFLNHGCFFWTVFHIEDCCSDVIARCSLQHVAVCHGKVKCWFTSNFRDVVHMNLQKLSSCHVLLCTLGDVSVVTVIMFSFPSNQPEY